MGGLGGKKEKGDILQLKYNLKKKFYCKGKLIVKIRNHKIIPVCIESG